MKNNNNFCLAPFRGFYQGFQGKVSVCCQTPILIDADEKFEVLNNHPEIIKMREKFLKNEIPDVCNNCTNRIRNEMSKLCELNDDEELSTNYYKPVFMDILWSNKCNFACMGCKPSLSTTISSKYMSAYKFINPKEIIVDTKWSNDDYSNKIEYIIKNKDTIDLIHLNGGEPFIQDGFYDLLEKLLKNNITHIKIWTHTNGSITTYKGKNIIELLKNFERSLVVMSHDGIGKKGEYVRYGLKQNKWLENYNRIKNSGIDVYIQTCYNIFNCLTIDECAEWYKKNCHTKPKLSIWVDPTCFSPHYIQKIPNLYEKAKNILNDVEDQFMRTDYVKKHMQELKTESELFDMHMRFSESIQHLDKIRNTNFLDVFPELEELYF